MLREARAFGEHEQHLRRELGKAPYDVNINLDLTALLQDADKLDEVNEHPLMIAGLTNWDHDGRSQIVQYYLNQFRKPNATIAFFFFQAEDGIRDHCVTGVQTCALSDHTGISYAVFCLKTEKHTCELQSHSDVVCGLLLDKEKEGLWTIQTVDIQTL